MSEEKKIFWLENFNGNAIGGCFVRSNLFEIFNKFEKEFNKKIVGFIKPDSWNLELILENNDKIIE